MASIIGFRVILHYARLAVLVLAIGAKGTFGQTFVRVADASNPLSTFAGPINYTGASWINYDNDSHLDLFINNSALFHNTGHGNFVKVTTAIGAGAPLGLGNGNSWADYDNDGDIDVMLSGFNSYLYSNNGDGTFSRINTGDISDFLGNRGWSTVWGDYDNDGNVDLLITHPAGFVGSATTNHLFRNAGAPNYELVKVVDQPIVTGQAPYTVGSWSDYDMDGDLDLFIGAGPANGVPAVDYLYKNMLAETDTANFERITTGIIATERQDGQLWNWIDYDNDGDLDAYLTNWGGGGNLTGMANRLYRNDDNVFTKITTGSIVTDENISLSSIWADFDNDGDLDCYVTNDNSQSDKYYRNEGDGTFLSLTNTGLTSTQTHRGATAGDYDNDGDIDLAIVGPATFGLFENTSNNGNHWIKFKLEGVVSNRSGIGAKVRVRAVIGGNVVWQLRELSAQNAFNGHNSMRLHFGLADALAVDTLIADWPSGLSDTIVAIDADTLYRIIEGLGEAAAILGFHEYTAVPRSLSMAQNFPNPFNPQTTIWFELPLSTVVHLAIYDLRGREIVALKHERMEAGTHAVTWRGENHSGRSVPSGVYFVRLESAHGIETIKTILLK